jgi:hypothetical protein
LNEDTEDQVHWCFRAVSDKHHGNGALNRLRRAATEAGLDVAVPKENSFCLGTALGRKAQKPKTPFRHSKLQVGKHQI